jgi:hypothetical protein
MEDSDFTNVRVTTKANALINELVRQGYCLDSVNGYDMFHLDIWVHDENIEVTAMTNSTPFEFRAKRTKGLRV